MFWTVRAQRHPRLAMLLFQRPLGRRLVGRAERPDLHFYGAHPCVTRQSEPALFPESEFEVELVARITVEVPVVSNPRSDASIALTFQKLADVFALHLFVVM